MEIKGRITKAELSQKQRKDNSGAYTMLEVLVQIGTYKRMTADYRTQEFVETTEADELCKNYFHEDARAAAQTLHQGDEVMVKFHHFTNKYGRTETVIESITPVSQAQPQQQAPAPQLTAQAHMPAGKDDPLPF